MSASPDKMVGRLLDKRYRVTSVLGAGGMGSVYLATDERIVGRQVVVKIPHEQMFFVPEFLRRFTHEIRQLVALDHPHIVKVHDAGEFENLPYVVLQYLGGGSLDDRLNAKAGTLIPAEIMEWLPTIAAALDFIHRKGFIHRDIKPGNILFDDEGHVFVADFGIAKALGDKGFTRVTLSGAIVGSPAFMAPEYGRGTPGPAYDQFGLAAVVYRCLAGVLPHEHEKGSSPIALLLKKMNEPARPLGPLVPELPDGAVAAVMRALSMEPDSRFPFCADFAKAFEEGLGADVPKLVDSPKEHPVGGGTPSVPIVSLGVEGDEPSALDSLPYEIEESIGGGAYAQVYRARCPRESVAIKVARKEPRWRDMEATGQLGWARGIGFPTGPTMYGDPDPNEILSAEADVLRRVDHPAMVKLLDHGEVGNMAYVVTEFIEGANWGALIPCEGPPTIEHVCQLIEALLAMKEDGSLSYHGDIKPSNLFIDSANQVRIIDPSSGMTKFHEGTLLRSSMFLTPLYNPTYDESDIPAIGMLIMEVGARKHPLLEAYVDELSGRTGRPRHRLAPEVEESLELNQSLGYFDAAWNLIPWMRLPTELRVEFSQELEAIALRCLGLGHRDDVLFGCESYRELDELLVDLNAFRARQDHLPSAPRSPMEGIEVPGEQEAPPQMKAGTDMVGRTFNHYEILEPLDAGDTGEVYRARDTKLNRDVAIRVLPEKLAGDPVRLVRLVREAHRLASLNDSRIEAIHGLEEADGVAFLVLELVEGDTLADRLRKWSLPVEGDPDIRRQRAEGLWMALEIAKALGAAHEAGIVHLDLKPANVKITPDRQVKVLGFGLASAFGVDGSRADVHSENGDPRTRAETAPTVEILRTTPYMSPEQARGEMVDRRADIWAFGCILYEILTGRDVSAEAAFNPMAGSLERTPPWYALPFHVSDDLSEVLPRCLERDPGKRLRDIREVRVEVDFELKMLERSICSCSWGPGLCRELANHGFCAYCDDAPIHGHCERCGQVTNSPEQTLCPRCADLPPAIGSPVR